MNNPSTFEIRPNTARRSTEERRKLLDTPGFGRIFTDHMVTIEWNSGQGWHRAAVRAREPFTLDPASAVLHYAQEIFEGMKAYRHPRGELMLFRPRQNAQRFNRSAHRLSMPELPEETFLAAIEQLVRIDAEWVPEGEGSLYIRPFMFANDIFLGVRPAEHYTFCVIASPVGAYFKGGGAPIAVWVSTRYSRAADGGTGCSEVRWKLCREFDRTVRGEREWLRPGGVSGRHRMPLGRRAWRHEHILRHG